MGICKYKVFLGGKEGIEKRVSMTVCLRKGLLAEI